MPIAIFLFVAVAAVLYVAARGVSSADDPAGAELATASAEPASLVDEVVAAPSELATALGHAVDQVKKLWSPPAAAAPYVAAIGVAEETHGIPTNLLARQLDIESGHFNPAVIAGDVKSSAGAIGIGQFEPGTAQQFGIDPTDAPSAINAAAKYMRQLYDKFGSWELALAAYNWGPGHVQKYLNGTIAELPAETQTYIDKILGPIGLATS